MKHVNGLFGLTCLVVKLNDKYEIHDETDDKYKMIEIAPSFKWLLTLMVLMCPFKF